MRLEKNVCKSIPPFLSWNLSKYESFKTKPIPLSLYRFCKRKRSYGKHDCSPTSTRKTSGFGDYTIIWNLVERVRVELTTPRFSVLCSTCWATVPYGASGGTWTHNLQIKSLLLYRLSYRCIWHPEKESNLYLKIRSFLFFPLNYRGIWWNRPVSNWLPLDFQSSALPVELLFHMVHLAGLEPATFRLKVCYSAKLSYRCK